MRKIKFKHFFLFILAGIIHLNANAQARTVSGIVKDALTGEPMPIVNIWIKDTKVGTLTDSNGRYQISINNTNSILLVSFLGYNTEEIDVGDKTQIDINLTSEDQRLDEVVVIAYGEQKRSSFTGSAAVVSSDAIARRPVSNVMNTLEGMTSGVQIQNASGAPDASPSFRIRGASSINAGKDPLVVVDGVPYESGWNNINPSDVESVTVLKDAASTAIYGARGGNGVVLITTKKAGRQEKTSISFDTKLALTKVRKSDLYDVIRNPGEYYERHYEAMYNYFQNVRGLNTYFANKAANESFTLNSDQGGLGYLVYTIPDGETLIGYNGKLNPNASLGRLVTNSAGQTHFLTPDDWVEETFKTGFMQDYNLSIKGGTEKLNLLASAGYTDDSGITDASSYERFTGRLKGGFNARKWLKISGNLDIAVSKADSNKDYLDNSNNIFSNATRIAPIYPIFIRDINGNIIYDSNGKVYDYGDGTYTNSRPVSTGSNRLQEALIETRRIESTKLGAQGAADIILTSELTATLNVAYEEREQRRKTTGQPFYGSSNPGGTISVYSYKNESVNLQQLVNYNKNFGGHNLKATLLHESYKYNYYNLYGSRSNMLNYYENQELSGAITVINNNSYIRSYESEGFGGRILYDYKGIYSLDASFRRDASSRFHPDNRWGNFFSFGGAYLISREDYFKASWVEELKFKVSYGQNGNDQIGNSDIGYHLYMDTYNIENLNGQVALTFKNKGNKNITWETRTAINTGVEFSLFKGRIRGGIEYYDNKTSNMLASVSVPYSLGYSSYYDNVGSMSNKGLELDMHGDLVRSKKFKASIYFNASINKSKVIKLAKERTGETLYSLSGQEVAKGYSSGKYFYGEGLEFRTWRLKKFAGVDDLGQAMWYVQNESGLSTTTIYSSASYFDCGSSQPKLLGGFGGNLSWKSLELFFAFSYRLGGYAYDYGYATLMTGPNNGRTGYNYHKDSEKSWTPAKKSNDFPRWQYDDRDFTSASDRWLTKADYLSLQNITLSYTIPKKIIQNIGIEGLIISGGVDNIFCLTHRKGFLPSQDFDGDVKFGAYPMSRRFLLNFKFNF